MVSVGESLAGGGFLLPGAARRTCLALGGAAFGRNKRRIPGLPPRVDGPIVTVLRRIPLGGDMGSTGVMKQELHAERFADSLIR